MSDKNLIRELINGTIKQENTDKLLQDILHAKLQAKLNQTNNTKELYDEDESK